MTLETKVQREFDEDKMVFIGEGNQVRISNPHEEGVERYIRWEKARVYLFGYSIVVKSIFDKYVGIYYVGIYPQNSCRVEIN